MPTAPRRVAPAVPADSAKRDHRSLSAAEGAQPLDDPAVLAQIFEDDDEGGDRDALESLEAEQTNGVGRSVADLVERGQTLTIIDEEVSKLPARQREAFLLRYWEDMDVAETAAIMGCSEGSVKTHCSRANHSLAAALKARGITP